MPVANAVPARPAVFRPALFWRMLPLLAACALSPLAVPPASAGDAPAATAATAAERPDALIRKASDDLLARLRSDAKLKAGDPNRINRAVDELILPYVAFEKTTRLAVGRYWRQASADQRQTLVREFRNMLVRTYGGAVSQITGDIKVELRPFRAEPGATDVVVRTLVSDGQREPVQVHYRLEQTPQGWKVYDLNVMGIWFIENYRSQFASIAARDGVDGLIKSLRDSNAKMPLPTAS